MGAEKAGLCPSRPSFGPSSSQGAKCGCHQRGGRGRHYHWPRSPGLAAVIMLGVLSFCQLGNHDERETERWRERETPGRGLLRGSDAETPDGRMVGGGGPNSAHMSRPSKGSCGVTM